MTMFPKFLAAAAAVGVAVPAAAQVPYPYPQPYPGQPYPGQTYPGQQYGGNVFDQIIGQLVGNRYNMTDRRAISRCASAAAAQASAQYRGGYNQYGGYNQGYGGYGIAAPSMRVTAITDVTRRSNGLRVRGLLSSGYGGGYGGYGGYNQGYGGYPGQQAYAQGDLSFRCTVDYRGYVSDIRVRPNTDRRY